MSRILLVTALAVGLAVSGCGGGDDTATSEERAANSGAEATQGMSSPSQPTAAPPAAPSVEKPVAAFSGPDIAGLYLGMTPEQAKAVLEAYDENMRLQDTLRHFEYNALGKRYKTDNFIAATHGQMPGGSIALSVGYSYPPAEPRVVSITRLHRQTTEPLTQADYAQALIDKYGQPVEDINNGRTDARAERTLKWKLADTGELSCVSGASIGNSVLDRFIRDGRRMAEVDVTPEYAAQCAGLFEYTLRGEPVTNASGTLFDVWAQAGSEFAAQAWVQQQVEDKSRTGTAAPKL
ncbi:MAG: hypothetical protein KDI17_15615 [Halioglobus sp.]|nr:hypothetical protein [Halioglobus sp.]